MLSEGLSKFSNPFIDLTKGFAVDLLSVMDVNHLQYVFVGVLEDFLLTAHPDCLLNTNLSQLEHLQV